MLDGGPTDKLHYHFQFIYKTNNGSVTDDHIFMQDAYVVYPLSAFLLKQASLFHPLVWSGLNPIGTWISWTAPMSPTGER